MPRKRHRITLVPTSRRRLAALAVAAAIAAPVLAACGSGGSGGSGGGAGSLLLYNGQHEQTTQALVNAFQQQTGIKVTIRSGDEDQLAEQIMQEGPASPADLFYTENSPALMKLGEQHLLAPVDKATLAAVPAGYSAPDGSWAGISARVSAMVYNTKDVKPSQLPASVLDLASPKWAGKLGIAPGETDFLPVVTSVARTYGQQAALHWLQGLKSNAGSHVYPDNETLVSDVNSGQVQIGLIDHYYWYRIKSQLGASAMNSALGFFRSGDPGYVLDVSGAGVLGSSKHKAQAQKFLAFLVSAKGQQILANTDSFEYPIRPGIGPHPGLPPLTSLHPDPRDTIAELGDGSTALTLLQEAQLG